MKKWLLICSALLLLATATFGVADPNPGDPDLNDLKTKAEAGDANAQTELGDMYLKGVHVSQDDALALKWYQKAADQGNAEAQSQLGNMYAYSIGVAKNSAEAASWRRKSAEQGNASAQLLLGIMYERGEGVKQDSVAAAIWIKKAAKQGDKIAQNTLGNVLQFGVGVSKNVKEAASWYRKSADQGYASAQGNLGLMYESGTGVPQDNALAASWYRKAADQRDDGAEVNLGKLYFNGTGVVKDGVEASIWFLKAARQGNPDAAFNLAMLYTNGVGVTQNYVEGLAWCDVAAALGDEKSLKTQRALENALGMQITLQAQKRSKEIFDQIVNGQSTVKSTTDNSQSAFYDSSFGNPKASGTGVFVTTDGLILTAAHVVNGARAVKILTQQGLKSATVVTIDSTNDIALLKCDGQFPAVPVKNSKGAELGQPVFTIGFPDTQLQGFSPKMTQGEISSLSGVQDDPRDWQISVPVQPGNSGGPLFDSQGNTIGLVVGKLDAVITAQASGALPENVNYAVKSAYALPMLDPYSNKLIPEIPPTTVSDKMEDVVGRVQNSVVLILV
jgi:TPR repeat protein